MLPKALAAYFRRPVIFLISYFFLQSGAFVTPSIANVVL